MTLKVKVLRTRDDQPLENRRVYVKWRDGFSERRTGNDGVADTDLRGDRHFESITVDGKPVDSGGKMIDGQPYKVYVPN